MQASTLRFTPKFCLGLKPRYMRAHGRLWTILCLWLVLAPLMSDAQYFGQNKVRHETFVFKILHTEHLDIHYYDQEHKVAIEAGRMAERWYARLSKVLN